MPLQVHSELELIAGGIGIYILGLIFAIGVGAGIGALGGLLGRSQARKNAPPQPYQDQPYPGQPYPPQPYPGQPYPPQPYQDQPLLWTILSWSTLYLHATRNQNHQNHPGKLLHPLLTEWNPYNPDQPR